MKTYTLNLTADVPAILPGGNFLMLLDTYFPVTVEPIKNASPMAETGEDVEGGYTIKPIDGTDKSLLPYFDSVRITSEKSQTIKVAISQGSGEYRRSIGVVEIIDQAASRAKNEAAYMASVGRGATSGVQSFVGVHNDALNDIDQMIIRRVFVHSATAGTVALSWGTTIYGASVGNCENIKAGGDTCPPDYQRVTGTTTGSPPLGNGDLGEYAIEANKTLEIVFANPVIVPGGYAFYVRRAGTNATIQANIQFELENV